MKRLLIFCLALFLLSGCAPAAQEPDYSLVLKVMYNAPVENTVCCIWYGAEPDESSADFTACRELFTESGWEYFTKSSSKWDTVVSYHDMLMTAGASSSLQETHFDETGETVDYAGESRFLVKWTAKVSLTLENTTESYDVSGTFSLDSEGKIAAFSLTDDSGLRNACVNHIKSSINQ